MIPKITHQIWMQGFENLPAKFKKNVDDLHRMNPEYEHKQWNETELREECAKYSKECVDRFDSFEQMIMKVDFGRYVVLHNYGGISIDTDMAQLKPINNTPDIDSDKFMISKLSFPYNLFGMLNNAVIITPPQHVHLKNMIDRISKDNRTKNDFLTKELYTQNITGPFFVNDVIANSNIPYTVLDNKYYEPCNSNDILCSVDKDSIMDHQHELSWVSSYINVILKIVILFMRLITIAIGAAILFFVARKRGFFSRKRYRTSK